MIITELQNIKVYRVYDDMINDEMIIIVEDGEILCYTQLDIKYSNFEKAKSKDEK